jgi:hypothetical protein
MEIGDYVSHVGGTFASKTVIAIHRFHISKKSVDEFLLMRLVHHDKVLCQAGLPRVVQATEGDLGRCKSDVGRLVDDGRAFPSKLKDARHKVASRSLSDHLALHCRPGEANEVPLVVADLGSDLDTSLNNGVAILI